MKKRRKKKIQYPPSLYIYLSKEKFCRLIFSSPPFVIRKKKNCKKMDFY